MRKVFNSCAWERFSSWLNVGLKSWITLYCWQSRRIWARFVGSMFAFANISLVVLSCEVFWLIVYFSVRYQGQGFVFAFCLGNPQIMGQGKFVTVQRVFNVQPFSHTKRKLETDDSVLIWSQRRRVGRAGPPAVAFLVGGNEERRSEEEEYSEDPYYSPLSLSRCSPWRAPIPLMIRKSIPLSHLRVGNSGNLEQFEEELLRTQRRMTGLEPNSTHIFSFCNLGEYSVCTTLSHRAVHRRAAPLPPQWEIRRS